MACKNQKEKLEMDILKMDMGEWITNVHKGVESMRDKVGVITHVSVELYKRKWRSIYRVPRHVLNSDEASGDKLYRPQAVSLGPYHHGKTHLKGMEEHKTRALVHFLKRSGTQLKDLIQAFAEELEYFKEAYDRMDDSMWQKDTDKFIMLMILDGCFILEVLNVHCKNVIYPSDDPIFGIRGITDVLPSIKRDMLMLENQVPFRAVRILFAFSPGQVGVYGGDIPDELLYLLLRFFSTSTSSLHLAWNNLSKGPCLHLLDVYREVLLHDDFKTLYKGRTNPGCTRSDPNYADTVHFPSASKLYEAGIRFKRSSTTHLKDISFDRSTLRFPQIVIEEESISTLANLMAFELVHSSAGNEVTTYVFFMTCLIQNAEDVSLLKSSGIIQNSIRNDEDVAKSLSLLSRDVLLGPNNMLDDVHIRVTRKLKNNAKKRLNEWRLDLFRTYFKSPWGVISVFGAIVLFTLTTIQTVYTVLSYTHPK